MKFVILLCLSFLLFAISNAQQLTEQDVPKLVEVIDQEVGLNPMQRTEVTNIISASLKEHLRIQMLRIADVEKLDLIQKNQNTTRNKLEVVLLPEQYNAYVALLDGGTSISSTQPTLNNPSNVTGQPKGNIPVVTTPTTPQPKASSAIELAEQLGFTSTKKTEFVMAYENQEKVIKDIMSSGNLTETSSIELLTTILTTDFKIIDLGGKATYEQYFQMRQNGALNNSTASNKSVDINQVYTFYDLKETLDMTDAQTATFIQLFLKNEMEKKKIRDQNKGNATVINQKIKALEVQTLSDLKKILSDTQIKQLTQMLGK
jgi:hypothetical protein